MPSHLPMVSQLGENAVQRTLTNYRTAVPTDFARNRSKTFSFKRPWIATCPPGLSELPTTLGWKQFILKAKNGRVTKLRLEHNRSYKIQLSFDIGRYAIFDEKSAIQIILPLCALKTLKIGE